MERGGKMRSQSSSSLSVITVTSYRRMAALPLPFFKGTGINLSLI